MVAGGAWHSVALLSDGTVWAWGYNGDGELGNGNNTNSNVPVQVQNLRGIIAIAAGRYYSLALRSDGTVWGWGSNNYGQLGNGSVSYANLPVQVVNSDFTPLTGIKALAADDQHTLALKTDGTLLAWGRNNEGQLGIGNFIGYSAFPVAVQTLTQVKAISAGYLYSMAVKTDGTIWTWGSNTNGELGLGTTTNVNTPTQITALSGITAVSGNQLSLALKSDGTVWAWGKNNSGQLGNHSITPSSTSPLQVSGLRGVTAIRAGRLTAVAIKGDGTVWAWGYNGSGQLGNNLVSLSGCTCQITPVSVNNLTQAIGIGVGDDHGLAIVGTVSSPIVTVTPPSLDFGGQLKTTTSLTRSVTISNTGNASLTVNSASLGGTNAGDFAIVGPTLPFTVAPGSSKVISLTFAPPVSGYRVASLQINDTGADSPHIVPLSGYGQDTAPISGSVVNWGNNSQGQLGTGNYIGSPTPVMPTGLPGPVIAVAGGHDYSLALLTDGSVWAWGANGTGQLGNGSSSQSNLPVQVNISGVIAIAAGFWHAVALKSDGTVWAWGWNNFGQLGNNYDVTSNLPVQVLNSDYTIFSGVKAIAAGGSNSLALKQDGTLWAWGSNGSGQLGIGSTTPIPYSPNQVNISGSIQNFKVGDSFVLATKTDGSVWVWGKNDQGQLGLGTTANVNTPTQNSSLSGITDIGVGSIFGFALKNDGTVYSWGHNNRAELGRGNNTDSLVPVAVSGLRGATLVEGGDEFGLALKSDGTVWGWGYNNDGELGNGGQNNPNYNPGCACQVSPARSGSISQLLGLGAGDAHGMAIVGPINRPIFSSDSSLDFGNQVVGQTSLTSSITISNSGQVAFSISSLSLGGANSGNFSLVGATLPINVAGNSSVSLNLTFNPNVVGIRTATLPITSTAVDSPYILPLSGYGILTPPPLGSLRAWGENGFGELGTGNLINTNVITNVVGLGNVVAIASGDNHNLALLVDGTVWAWGYNGYGQLGNGTNTNSNIPLKVPGLRGVTAIAASSNQSFALRSDGTLWGWGSNGNGALGLGHNINRNVPTQVLNNDYSVFGGVKQVAAGGDHTFAQKQDGSWWVWGTNSAGQLGIGSTVSPYYFPTPFNSLPGVSQLSAGYSHTLALKNDGTVYVWGDNTYGQLGLGNTQAISVPVKINNNTYTAIGTGTYHSLATRSDATVWAWGYNSNGQLGNNSIAQSNIPVQVSGISGATGLAGSGLHSLAAVGGLVYAWGYNGYGQLGDGTNTQRLTPV